MKSNKFTVMKNDSTAQVGIGTLIIFIAMVLIASVAAGVLIQTSGVLQQRAQSTGKEVTEEVSSNLKVISIEGIRAKNNSSAISDSIDLLKIKTGLNAGSSNVDLSTLVITITDGLTTNELIYASNNMLYGSPMKGYTEDIMGGNLGPLVNETHTVAGDNIQNFFVVQKLRDDDQSITAQTPMMTPGDIAIIYIGTVSAGSTGYNYISDYNASNVSDSLKFSGLTFTPRAGVDIQMTPERGSQTILNFPIPTLTARESFLLYP